MAFADRIDEKQNQSRGKAEELNKAVVVAFTDEVTNALKSGALSEGAAASFQGLFNEQMLKMPEKVTPKEARVPQYANSNEEVAQRLRGAQRALRERLTERGGNESESSVLDKAFTAAIRVNGQITGMQWKS